VSDCVFDAIVSGDHPAEIVLADEVAVAFLDARPLFTRVQRVSAALPAALGAQGTFVAMNNVVSQSVPHVHVHVVPRTRGDGLRGFFWPRQRYADEAEAAAYAQRIRTALAGSAD